MVKSEYRMIDVTPARFGKNGWFRFGWWGFTYNTQHMIRQRAWRLTKFQALLAIHVKKVKYQWSRGDW